jgi:proline dehydrogenase
MSVKVTGLAREALLEKLNTLMKNTDGNLIKRYEVALDQLSKEEQKEWERVKERLFRICTLAQEKNVGMMIDAEETWITEPLDALTTLMMTIFNKEKPVIYNTAQLYRNDRLQFVKDCYEEAVAQNFIFAIKLVRGAYMEKERERAIEKNYPSPIYPDKNATDEAFNDAVKFCIDHVNHVAVSISTHNEKSNMVAVEQLMANDLPFNHPHVSFSQLYGMSDNITFNLAHADCNVSKYLPFGPIEEVIPYLMRRAEENTSVKGQTGRELGLIRKEIKRRKSLQQG